MTVIPLSLTQANLQTVQGQFIESILDPSVYVVAAQQNRVSPPVQPDYVIMTMIRRTRLATNSDTWDTTDPLVAVLNVGIPMESVTQLDVHGPNSADNATTIATLWRDNVATTFFAASGFNASPLYATPPRQVPFVNAEEQWENRWIVEIAAQGNFVLEVPQQFATTANVGIVELA